MNLRAEGHFDVKNTPLGADETTSGTGIGRFALDKQYHGDLEGTAKGLMLGFGNPAEGAAGYVAIEQVEGTLDGRVGSFALQHFGAMDAGNLDLTLLIVPGSGTAQLAGLAGTMTFKNASGKHSYAMDYVLPEP
jgi:Protein of unknown function (DUF3224)